MGTEHASREPYIRQAKEYAGPDLVLTDAEILCSVAKFCERAGGIWKLILESANSEAREIAIQEAAACPSGRLVVWDKQTRTPIEPRFEPSIGLVEYPQEGLSGPVWVRGGIPVISDDGWVHEIPQPGHPLPVRPFLQQALLRQQPSQVFVEKHYSDQGPRDQALIPPMKGLVARQSIKIHAPPARVWKALTDPDLIKEVPVWHAGQHGLESRKSNQVQRGLGGQGIRGQRDGPPDCT